jgi:hypothetical protein
MTTTRRLAAFLAADVTTKTADFVIEETRAKSVHGMNRTSRSDLTMSVDGGRPEVIGSAANRRD